ncbi:unnamed protein product [Closterium sp. NIES-54]
MMEGAQILGFFDGSLQYPTHGTQYDKQQYTYQAMMAYTILLRNITPNQQQNIRSYRGYGNSAELAYNHLKNLYQATDSVNQIRFMAQLTTVEMKPGKKGMAYISRCRELRDKLLRCGGSISEDAFVTVIIGGLGPQWRSTRAILRAHGKISEAALCAKIHAEQQDRDLQEERHKKKALVPEFAFHTQRRYINRNQYLRSVTFARCQGILAHTALTDNNGLSLFDLTSGASPAPPATADSTVRSQWATRDAAARLAVRRHLPTTERAHFSQYKSAQTLYDAVVARYSFPTTADSHGWQFYHPTSCRVLSSQDVTFDKSVPYYRLFPYRTAPLPPPPLFLAPGPPPVDPLPPQGPAPSGVSQVDAVEPVEVAVDSGAVRGAEPVGAGSGDAEPAGAEPGGAEPGGAESGGAESGGAESGGAEPGGTESGGAGSGGAEPGGAEPWGAGSTRVASCSTSRAAGAGGTTVAAGSGGTRPGGTGAAGAGGAAEAAGVGPARGGSLHGRDRLGGHGCGGRRGRGYLGRRELVGCLMYLMTCTRPDLAYPLSILARYVAPGRHRPEHMAAAKRVLRYLYSTSGLGLVLGGRSPVVFTGHADASWVDDLATQRSSQGYTFSLGSGSISWRSTRSSSVLCSSCEAEIYAGAMAAQELCWLTYLLTDLGEPPRSPPVLYVDNKAMLALCQEHRLEHGTKHIALRYFFARELQQRGQLRLAYVASEANTADIFTKALPPGDHQRFCTMLEGLGYILLNVSQLMAKGIHLEAESTIQEFKLFHGRGGLYIGKAVLKNNVFVLDFVPDLGTADSEGIVTFTSWTHPPDLDPDFSPEGFWYSHTIPEAERT